MQKVLAEKGAHQVGQVTSRGRGEIITQVGFIGASGLALPPIWVFLVSEKIPPEYLQTFHQIQMTLAHKSGWMT